MSEGRRSPRPKYHSRRTKTSVLSERSIRPACQDKIFSVFFQEGSSSNSSTHLARPRRSSSGRFCPTAPSYQHQPSNKGNERSPATHGCVRRPVPEEYVEVAQAKVLQRGWQRPLPTTRWRRRRLRKPRPRRKSVDKQAQDGRGKTDVLYVPSLKPNC